MKSFLRIIFLLLLFIFTAAFHGPCNVQQICGAELDPIPYNYEYVVLGDSIFASYTGECQNVASRLSLSLGERIHSEAVSGARISAAWETEDPLSNNRKRPAAIETQFELALKHAADAQKDLNPEDRKQITTVVLDGGANETILEGHQPCYYDNPADPNCVDKPVCDGKDLSDLNCAAHLMRIANDLSILIDKMKEKGVKKVIYSGYYPLRYSYSSFNEALLDLNDIIQSLLLEKGEEEGIQVIFVDQQNAFEGDICAKTPECPQGETCYDHYLSGDKLHPSPYGSAKLAENIFETAF